MPSSGFDPHDPSIPPPNGSSPLMQLPTELRKQIFCSSLLAREIPVQPLCQEHFNPPKNGETGGARHNRTSDLMVINKDISEEVAHMVYEERTFVIHVHEGIRKAGIEFLDTGRQPLQYQEEITDCRFRRFQHGDKFGFHRVKKVKIVILPSDPEDSVSNHVPINTFFICSALSQLLDRGHGEGSKNKINHLSIEFAKQTSQATPISGRRAMMKAESYWWDPETQGPRASSWHNISNVEIALRGFSALRSHNVDIHLPNNVRNHTQTLAFVEMLKGIVKSPLPSSELDDDFWNYQIHAARQAMEDHVIKILYNVSGERHHVSDLTAEDFQEDFHDGAVKHDLSPTGKYHGGQEKRHKRMAFSGNDEDDQDSLKDMLDVACDKKGDKRRAALGSFRSLNPAQVYRVRFNKPNASTRKSQPDNDTSSSPKLLPSHLMEHGVRHNTSDDDDETWRAADRASIEEHEEQQPGNLVFPARADRALGLGRHDSGMADTQTSAGVGNAEENSEGVSVAGIRPGLSRMTFFAHCATRRPSVFGSGRTIASATHVVPPSGGLQSEFAALNRERERRFKEREMDPRSHQHQHTLRGQREIDEYNVARAFAKLRNETGVTSVDARQTYGDARQTSQETTRGSTNKWVLHKKGSGGA
ncbi:hypothetical protein Tdes44962_MAKER03586 [Teratosphaeria destructans]|uniref:Uncharacterized protein n=1 Tax=Teratosphaeria destructans TaxID=418781 RepID=A0A9W7W169_9PEZI|nr:hypothetical protein Tdes44962_MAKER03586 [Teratosphaeria destructans]